MTIRDMGYKPYDGPLLAHNKRHWVMVRRMVVNAWASRLVKLTLICSLIPMVICGVLLVIQLKFQSLLTSRGGHMQMDIGNVNSLIFYCFFWCQLWFAFGVSQLVGAPAIAEDIRTGAFSFYFSKPMSAARYLWGKILPVGLLVLAVSAVPALVLSLLRLVLAKDGADALACLGLVASTLLYTPFYVAVFSVPAVAVGSLARRSATAQSFWTFLFFFSWILGKGLASGAEMPYLVLLSLPTDLMLVGQHLYGIPPTYAVPWYYPPAVLVAVTALCVHLLSRRLGRVEVFA